MCLVLYLGETVEADARVQRFKKRYKMFSDITYIYDIYM